MIVYDAGALVASERNVRQMWALHGAALRRGITPIVPAGVLAPAWRGGPQARLSQLLRGCVNAPLDEPLARDVGSLCATANASDVVDASVVLVARSHHAAIVTSDEPDIRHLATLAGAPLLIHKVWTPTAPDGLTPQGSPDAAG